MSLEYKLLVATHRLKAETAAIRLIRSALALRDALECRYRPDQPRAPRGTPEGGQWIDDTSAESTGADEDPVFVAAKKADIRYIDYLMKKYGLSLDDREILHELITKQGYSKEEIRKIVIEELVRR